MGHRKVLGSLSGLRSGELWNEKVYENEVEWEIFIKKNKEDLGWKGFEFE